MNNGEYYAEIQELADDLVSDCRNGDIESSDDLSDRVHEMVDGHEWIIYTGYAQEVVVISDNDGYSVENFGADCIVTDGCIDWSVLAYGAMYADLWEALYVVDDFEPYDESTWIVEPEEVELEEEIVEQEKTPQERLDWFRRIMT